MPPHVVEHVVHECHVVGPVFKNSAEHVGIRGLCVQRAVEDSPGLKRAYAEQHLQRVEHRIHGAEIIDFSLIERLHGELPDRHMKQEDPSARTRSHPSVFPFLRG